MGEREDVIWCDVTRRHSQANKLDKRDREREGDQQVSSIQSRHKTDLRANCESSGRVYSLKVQLMAKTQKLNVSDLKAAYSGWSVNRLERLFSACSLEYQIQNNNVMSILCVGHDGGMPIGLCEWQERMSMLMQGHSFVENILFLLGFFPFHFRKFI